MIVIYTNCLNSTQNSSGVGSSPLNKLKFPPFFAINYSIRYWKLIWANPINIAPKDIMNQDKLYEPIIFNFFLIFLKICCALGETWQDLKWVRTWDHVTRGNIILLHVRMIWMHSPGHALQDNACFEYLRAMIGYSSTRILPQVQT